MDTLNHLREYFGNYSGFLTSLYDAETIRMYLPIYSAALAGILFNLEDFWFPRSDNYTLLYWTSNRLSILNIAYWVILFVYSVVTFFIAFGKPISENLFIPGAIDYGQFWQTLFAGFKLPAICVIAYFVCRVGFLPLFFTIFALWCMWATTFIFATAATAFTGAWVLVVFIAPISGLLWWLWRTAQNNGKG